MSDVISRNSEKQKHATDASRQKVGEQKAKPEGQARFDIILTGNVVDGFDRDEVIVKLAKALKIPQKNAELLLRSRHKCIRYNTDAEVAEKYKRVLIGKGVEVYLKTSRGRKVSSSQGAVVLKDPAAVKALKVERQIKASKRANSSQFIRPVKITESEKEKKHRMLNGDEGVIKVRPPSSQKKKRGQEAMPLSDRSKKHPQKNWLSRLNLFNVFLPG